MSGHKQNEQLENFLLDLLQRHGSLGIRKIEGYVYISDLEAARYWDRFDIMDSLRDLRLVGKVKYDNYPDYKYRLIRWDEESDYDDLMGEM